MGNTPPTTVVVNYPQKVHSQNRHSVSSSHSENSSSSNSNGSSKALLRGEDLDVLTALQESLNSLQGEMYSVRRKLGCAIALSFILFLTTATAIIILLITLYVPESTLSKTLAPKASFLKPDQNRYKLCLPCHSLKLPTPAENEVLKRLEKTNSSSGELCCAKNSSHVLLLMQLVFQQQLRHERMQGNLCPFKTKDGRKSVCAVSSKNSKLIAAHVVHDGSRYKKPVGQRPPFILTKWTTNSPVAFGQGIRMNSGQLVIPVDGLYYVYSQVYFSKSRGSSPPDNSKESLSHYLFRHSASLPNGGEDILVRHGQSKCWAEKNDCLEYTSYIAGMYYLHAEDRISAKVSHLHLVHHSQKYSYLGIYKL